MQDIENIRTHGFQSIGLSEEDPQEEVPTQTQVPPQRKRQRGPSTSQSVDDEPAWVGGFFNHLSLIESNFNTRFDHVDTRLDSFEQRMDHLEHDIHHLYAHQNIQCTWNPPPLPPPLFQDP